MKPQVGHPVKIMSAATRGFTLVTCVATLDVPRHVVEFVTRHLAAHRRRIGTPPTACRRWQTRAASARASASASPSAAHEDKSERALHVDTRMFSPSRIGDIARAAFVLNGIWT